MATFQSNGVMLVLEDLCSCECVWNISNNLFAAVPNLEVSVDLEKAVLHVRDVPEGQHFNLWLYLNRTGRFEGLGKDNLKLLTGPENMTIPISQVFPCLCLQVWPNVKDQDLSSRTHLCPFANDTEALTRAWAKSHLEVKAFEETVSGSLAGPCDLPGEMVPCWRGELLACHPLHPQLHLALTPREPVSIKVSSVAAQELNSVLEKLLRLHSGKWNVYVCICAKSPNDCWLVGGRPWEEGFVLWTQAGLDFSCRPEVLHSSSPLEMWKSGDRSHVSWDCVELE
ncbi:Interleukin-17 receptor C [Varanus komodoensis]|nr:Interleukin-17 receptor C [Varanus komodoensis]